MVSNSNKTTKRLKKPIETTLGKATTSTHKGDPDVSHLRRPIDTSVTGLRQIVSLIENGTAEVKDILTYECDILYECRTCRSIFRSLANFILHKRSYCQGKFYIADFIINDNNNANRDDEMSLTGHHQPRENQKLSRLNKVVEKLHEIGKVHEATKPYFAMDLSEEDPVKSMHQLEAKFSNFNQLVLEKIDSNDSGVFQTLNLDASLNSNKLDVMELHRKLEHDVPVLDSEGKTFGFTSSDLYPGEIFPSSVFACTKCSNKYSSEKTLAHHIRTIHNPTRLVFLCPACNEPFANPWCVYRHLLRVHRMTNRQVRRVREQVNNSVMSRGEYDAKIDAKKPRQGADVIGEGDCENQWIADIEGDKDFQICAGCGKHFERKAALHAHAQMCAKRTEMFNSIKEKARKRALEEGNKARAETDKVALKGASKRKARALIGCVTNNNHKEIAGDKSNSDNSILRTTLQKVKTITQSKSEETISVRPKRSRLARRSHSSSIETRGRSADNDVICLSSDESKDNSSTSDLFSNEVSFEKFISFGAQSRNDDVIFVDETSSAEPNGGFPGSNNVNLSELSYNNPLKKLRAKTTLRCKAAPYMDSARLACLPCKTTFATVDLLMWHMSAHFSWFRFQCSKCSFVTYAESDCLCHVAEDHLNLPEDTCAVLPLPNWKSVLMSHDFQPLDPDGDFRGRHTDEKICLDDEDGQREYQQKIDNDVTHPPDVTLFGDDSTEEAGPIKPEECLLESDEEIDMLGDEGADLHVLPEPVELEMPAIISESLKTSEDTIGNGSESGTPEQLIEEESNDDWGIPPPKKHETPLPVTNSRPARIRTTVKQDDFLYYDRR